MVGGLYPSWTSSMYQSAFKCVLFAGCITKKDARFFFFCFVCSLLDFFFWQGEVEE